SHAAPVNVGGFNPRQLWVKRPTKPAPALWQLGTAPPVPAPVYERQRYRTRAGPSRMPPVEPAVAVGEPTSIFAPAKVSPLELGVPSRFSLVARTTTAPVTAVPFGFLKM